MLKLLLSYSYTHKDSSAGKRLRMLNDLYLQKSGWLIVSSNIDSTEKENVEVVQTFFDEKIKPISYLNTSKRRSLKAKFKRVLWPDRGVFWAAKTLFLLCLRIRKEKEVKIVAVCYPFSTLIVGAVLKKIYQKRIVLISHFIDGFYLINKGSETSSFYSRLNYRVERFINHMSDKIIVCEDKKIEFEKVFPSMVPKVSFLPTMEGINIGELEKIKGTSQNVSKIHLFAGSLYSDIRDPKQVLEIYKHLKNQEMYIAGNLNDCGEMVKEATWISYLGILGEDELLTWFKRSQYLVNIDNQDGGQQSPGKIVEYMLLQKPIINFYKVNSLSQVILNKHGRDGETHLGVDLTRCPKANAQEIQEFLTRRLARSGKLFHIESGSGKVFRAYEEGRLR